MKKLNQKKFLFIEIKNNQVELLIFKVIKSSYETLNKEVFTFSNLEVLDGVIFNQGLFVKCLKKYLDQSTFKSTRAIVCIPSLKTMKEEFVPFLILNIVLPIHRANLKVLRIIDSKPQEDYSNIFELRNYKDLFMPQKGSNPYFWSIGSLISASILFYVLFNFSNVAFEELKSNELHVKNLKAQSSVVSNLAERLKSKRKELNSLEKMDKITKSNELIFKSINNIFDFFNEKSLNSLWLSSISISRNKDKKKNLSKNLASITLDGFSFDLDAIFTLNDVFSNSKDFINSKIDFFEKITKSHNLGKSFNMTSLRECYKFKLSTDIKNNLI